MNFVSPIDLPVDILKNDKFKPAARPNHQGIDLRPKSDNIYASHSGKVTFSGKDQFGGLFIDITNGRYKTRYLHNRQNLVRLGQQVNQGQLIGYIGNTGQSTGRHLHFEIWVDGIRQNPESYINFNPKPPHMTQSKLLDSIRNNTVFDETTKNQLIAAVHNDDAGYLVAFAGSEPRIDAKNKQTQLEAVTLENLALKKELESKNTVVVENAKPFTPRTESIKAFLGMLKNTILPSTGTILIGSGALSSDNANRLTGIITGAIALIGAVLLEMDKTNYNKQEKENAKT